MKNRRRSAFVVLCTIITGFLTARIAVAGSFTISPIRVDLTGAHSIEAVTVRNEDDAPLLIQAKIVAWSQEGNEEHYADTRDLLLTPPIFQLAPKGEQILRIALRRSVDPAKELDYRLILNEVPQPAADNFVGLKVALRMSVPVFVSPVRAPAAELLWTVERLSDGTLQVRAANNGAAHRQVMDFGLKLGPATIRVGPSRYVLPGNQVTWTIKLPAEAGTTSNVTIDGFSDRGEFNASLLAIDQQHE